MALARDKLGQVQRDRGPRRHPPRPAAAGCAAARGACRVAQPLGAPAAAVATKRARTAHLPSPPRPAPAGKALLAPYLPRDGGGGSPYSEGGALYALGLIAANHGAGHRAFLLESLRAAGSPVTQHGACLGLGLACLGTGDEEAFEDLKNTLYTDDAVAGEAAGLAMGLLLAGSSSDKAQEMLVRGAGGGGVGGLGATAAAEGP